MGSTNAKAQKLKYDPERWETIKETPFYDVLKHREAQIEKQLFHFVINEKWNTEDELDIYDWRSDNTDNCVRVSAVRLEKSGFGFCGTQNQAEVLTERIPFLLQDVRMLSPKEGVIVVYNALKGFKRVYEKFGSFEVTDQLIGFTPEGETKVWHNQNFGMNHFYNEKETTAEEVNAINRRKTDNSREINAIIESTVTLVSNRTNGFPVNLLNSIRTMTSFQESLNFISLNGQIPQGVLQTNKIDLRDNVPRAIVPQRSPSPSRPVEHQIERRSFEPMHDQYRVTQVVEPPRVYGTVEPYRQTDFVTQTRKIETVESVRKNENTSMIRNNMSVVFNYENPSTNYQPNMSWKKN